MRVNLGCVGVVVFALLNLYKNGVHWDFHFDQYSSKQNIYGSESLTIT